MQFPNKFVFYFLFFGFVFFHLLVIASDACTPDNTRCPFATVSEKIKYYSKGAFIPDFNDNSTLDTQFFDCVNYYYKCGYVLEESDENYKESGVHIGYGIDISTLNILSPSFGFSEKLKTELKNYYMLKGDAAKEMIEKQKLILSEELVNELNEKTINYYKNELITNYSLDNFFNSGYFLTPMLSIVLRYGFPKGEVDSSLKTQQMDNLGFVIDNYRTGNKNLRQIQATAISTKTAYCDTHYQIGFVADKNSTSWSQVVNFFRETLQLSSHQTNDNLFSFGFVVFGEEGTCISDFSNKTDEIMEKIKQYKLTSETKFDIQKGIDKMTEHFDKNPQSVFHQKIIVLILTTIIDQESTQTAQMIKNLKTKGYQVIIVGIRDQLSYYEQMLGEKSNILLYDKPENLVTLNILPISLHSSICHQLIPIFLNEANMNPKISNLEINKFESPDYFNVKVDSITGSFNYKVELIIEDRENAEFNMFGSKTNPFPNVNNHDVKHMGINLIENPFIIIKTPIQNNEFFVSVIGNSLKYDIQVSIISNEETTVLSNGLFKTSKVETKIQVDPSTTLYSFRKCHESICNFRNTNITDPNDLTKKNIISLAKYYSRGINLTNSNEETSQNFQFFNENLFSCLFRLYTCVYVDPTKGAQIGLPATSLLLSTYSPFGLVKEYIPKILVNKLRAFQVEFNNDPDKVKTILSNENVEFSRKEVLQIYQVSKRNIVSNITSALNNCRSCPILFEELDANLKFILFMNKFRDVDLDEIISNISKGELHEYLTKLYQKAEAKGNIEYYFENILLHSMLNDNREKSLISLIVGKSLFYTEQFLDFIKIFVDEICIHENKISLSLFDEQKQKIIQIFEFSKKNTQLKEEIINYRKKYEFSFENINPDTELPLANVVESEVNHFNTFDKGIKKVIIVIGDEQFKVDDKIYINHKINLDEIEYSKLEDAQINLLVMTSISPESNYSKYVSYYSKKLPLEAIYPVKNFDSLENEVGLLSKALKQIVIRIPNTFNIINDFYKDKQVYYEIPIDTNYISQNIIINSKDVNVYASFDYPYPNQYRNSYQYLIDESKKEEYTNITIPFDLEEGEEGFLFLTLEPKTDIHKVKINLYVCNDDGVCTGKSSSLTIYIIVLVILGIGLFVYGLCSCRSEEKIDRKKYNRLN